MIKSVYTILIVAGLLSACSKEPEPVFECSKLTEQQTLLLNKSFDTCMNNGYNPNFCSVTARKTYCTAVRLPSEQVTNALRKTDRVR